MVITYSSEKLMAIGKMVIIRDCLTRVDNSQPTVTTTTPDCPYSPELIQAELLKLQQQIYGEDFQYIQPSQSQCDSQEPLTSSVAEFFRKAQQNFYAQATIDPTKVRRLSEIEAELIQARRDSY